MKIRFSINDSTEKKRLITAVSSATSAMPKYLGVPTMAYQIGDCLVEKDGGLIVPDSMDATEMIRALVDLGFRREVVEQTEIPADAGATGESTAETAEGAMGNAADAAPEPIALSISFPLSKHTGRSIKNLVNLIYSRGSLVSKAVQGEFSASKEIVNGLNEQDLSTAKALVEHIRQIEEEKEVLLKGIIFDEEKVTFTGFPETTDTELLTAFQHLAEKMNNQAITQKRIQSKAVDEENEKYAMRTWLVRIGMGGDEYKKTRSLLMEHLKGHTAFKTPADADRWKARQAKIKEERKAAQEETA